MENLLDRTETAEALRDTLGVVTRALVAQAFALDDMFYRAAREAFSTEPPSYHHARTALRAQARCRATVNVLLALRAARAAGKISNFDGGSIQALKTIMPAKDLPSGDKAADAGPAACPKRRTLRSTRWTAERRARQAAAIRAWQPWRKSTGPKTQDGKVRSARNAVKHGFRSKAFIEARREDRRIFARAAENLAILRLVLAPRLTPPAMRSMAPALSAVAAGKTEAQTPCRPQHPALFHSIDIGPAPLALIPFRPANYRGIAARRHPPPVRPRAPRRRWRIAS
jgi:hypothetical protein